MLSLTSMKYVSKMITYMSSGVTRVWTIDGRYRRFIDYENKLITIQSMCEPWNVVEI
jgi:hypothetical protein